MPNPGPPNTLARQKVAAALVAVTTAAENETNADADLKNRYVVVRSKLIETTPWYLRWKIDEGDVQAAALSDHDYLRLQEGLRTAITKNYAAHNAAILEAAKAYQLFPPIMDFTGDPRAAGANMVDKPWLPHYSRHEKRDDDTGQWRKRRTGELAQEQLDNALGGGGVMAARTRGNGVMEFYGQAFASPEELAVNIFHETSHWVDIAGKSGGFKKSDLPQVSFRTEQHAYERAAAFALQIGANAQKHLDLAKQFELQAKECEDNNLTWPQVILKQGWIGKDRSGSLAMAPAESEISPDDDALLQKKFSEAGAKAAAQAREQVEIAHRDHDERLKNTMGDLTARSCANPGSVSQDELNSLPQPYNENFDASKLPNGVENCHGVYFYLVRGGRDAEVLLAMSTPPPNAQVPPSAVIPARPIAMTQFSGIYPQLKEFSIAACRDLSRAPRIYPLYRQYAMYYPVEDANLAQNLMTGQDNCTQQLFYKIIERTRANNGYFELI
jgi:hypothetical protein